MAIEYFQVDGLLHPLGRNDVLSFVNSLAAPELQAAYYKAEAFVRDAVDTQSKEFQIAAKIYDVFWLECARYKV